MSKADTPAAHARVLFTCVGRRVELLQAFRRAAGELGVDLTLYGVDNVSNAPGLFVTDRSELVPPVEAPDYIATLIELVRREEIDLLVPTIDTDLLPLSAARDDFSAAGCTALIAARPMIELCRDKTLTYKFLTEADIDTPRTYTPDEIREVATPPFPLFLKPRTGSASHSIRLLRNQADLDYQLARVSDPIIQEYVQGVEHTLDVYVGLSGQVRTVVPRRRLQVRGGEVSKGMTVKDREIMDAGRQVVETLGPTVRGVITLQCIVTSDGRIRFIEINPRFGGGAPLSIAAGADFPRWLLQELQGQDPKVDFDGWQDRLCMFRYDWSVFVAEDALQRPAAEGRHNGLPDFE